MAVPNGESVVGIEDTAAVSDSTSLSGRKRTGNEYVCMRADLGAHPERGLQFDVAVCTGLLQLEALIYSHVGGVEEATEGQDENTQLGLLLILFDLMDT